MANLEDFEPAGTIVELSASASDIARYSKMKGLWVGTGGTVTIVDYNGSTLTDFPVLAGVNPIRIKRLTAIGTASDIYALF